MAQQSRVLDVLPEDTNLVSSTHASGSQLPETPALGDLTLSSGFHGPP